MSLRGKRKLVALGTNLFVIAILLAMGSGEIGGLFILIAIIYAFACRRLPFGRWAAQRFIQETQCPACGWELPLVDRWRCACGYVNPEERHLFEPCRHCGEESAWIECPACGVGIRL